MRQGLYLAPFGELADPMVIGDLAAAAEDAEWDGLFLWDHIWRPTDSVSAVGDATVSLAAAATRTSRLRIGPMITPLARRRPQKVARETVALDHLSRGRLILGVGLGVDSHGEMTRLGEVSDDRDRGDVLDEALEVLLMLWSGERVTHHGQRFHLDDVAFRPTPLQSPRIPVWGAAVGRATPRSLRRAARLDGVFPVGSSASEVRDLVASIKSLRGSLEGFDVAVVSDHEPLDRLEGDGVTWVMRAVDRRASLTEVQAVVGAGPR